MEYTTDNSFVTIIRQKLIVLSYPESVKLYILEKNARVLTGIGKYSASNRIKFMMSWIQPSITWYAKKQKNMIHNQEKYQCLKKILVEKTNK